MHYYGLCSVFMLPYVFYKVRRNCKIKNIQMGTNLDVTDTTITDISDLRTYAQVCAYTQLYSR